MNFQLAGTGRSFKGAFAYYLHDKRADPSQPHPTTSERVAWMETRNLAVDDPAFVQGVMIATARSADDLKKAAGGKMTGRKAKGEPVFAYSLQWHPDKEAPPDKAGMLKAADETLRLLGAEGRQAVIIAHRDTAHPHVHVIVNRIDPETGKTLNLDKNAAKLDAWARDYERERGQIVSPNREAKYQQQEQARRKERDRADAQLEQAKPAPRVEKVAPAKDRPKTEAAKLAERQAEQQARQKQEWADLSAANKARREQVKAERIDFKAIARDHRAEVRGEWSQFGKAQAAERRAFHQREKQLSGVVKNAMDAARDQQRRGVADDRGFLTMAFAYTINSQARAGAFVQRQAAEKELLKRRTDAALLQKFEAAKAAQAAKLAEVRKTYDSERAALITRQDIERDQVRSEWRKIYAQRQWQGRGMERPRFAFGRVSPSIDSQVRPAPGQQAKPRISVRADMRPQQQEQQPVKPEFERSADTVAPANLGAAPTRSLSVAMPAPAPTPEGVPQPPARRVQSVPDVDRSKEWARTQEGQQAAKQQADKAAPDPLRRAYRPDPEKVAHAKDQSAGRAPDRPLPPAMPAPSVARPARDSWKDAVAAPPPPKPARDAWKDAAKPEDKQPQRGPRRDYERD